MPIFQSWIVRYVPDAAREEFTNVAVIVGKDNVGWACGVSEDCPDYIKAMSIDFVHREGSEADLERFRLIQNNTVQLREPRPIQAEDVQVARDFLFKSLVE